VAGDVNNFEHCCGWRGDGGAWAGSAEWHGDEG
jgi:hypothetical protein